MSNTNNNLLKGYDTIEEYENVKCSLHEYAISYINETKEIKFQEESYIIATYNVTSTTSNTQLLGTSFTLSQITEMYIDDIKLDNVVNAYMFDTNGEHTIKFIYNKCITSCNSMFSNCENLTSLDLKSFDTSNVYYMNGMFSNCESLTSLDLSSFNTSKVTNMRSMFYHCSGLTSLDLSNFDTSKVTNMGDMFYRCFKLTSLNVSSFNTSAVTNMSTMFYYCYNLTSLNVSNFNTSKVTDISHMFGHCRKLTSLDLSNFDTSKVTDMENMFEHCSGLTSLDLSNFDTSKVTYMNNMFYNCSNLTSITFGYYSDVSKVTSYSSMFATVPSTCTLTLCSNTQTSWDALLTNAPFNGTVNYQTCTEPTTE